jgi:hypothetical protein
MDPTGGAVAAVASTATSTTDKTTDDLVNSQLWNNYFEANSD